MKVSDAEAGDLVVIVEDGAMSFVEVGAIAGRGQGKQRQVSYALVRDVDPETFRLVFPGTMPRLVEPDVEMVEVVERLARRIEMRTWKRGAQDTSEVVDPMSMKRKDGVW